MKSIYLNLALSIAVLSVTGCDNQISPASPGTSVAKLHTQIKFSGIGAHGLGDPSIAMDPTTNRLWMSYSSVDPSVLWPTQNRDAVGIRLAYSDDQGKSWVDAGVAVNPFLDVTTVLPAPNNAGTWNSEVSRIVYDPAAANANERWKIFWSHYLEINGNRNFEHGWIGYKAASTPQGLATATEVKLFGAAGYDSSNNTQNGNTGSPVGGAPAIYFQNLHADLHNCLVLTEPGVLATNSALYLSVMCAENGNSRIVLMKCVSPCNVTSAADWQYVGTTFQNSDATSLGYLSFSGPELFEENGIYYLSVTPVNNTPFPNAYHGCMIYRFANINVGKLTGSPTAIKTISGTTGSFNGACGYHPSAIGGFMYIQAFPSETEKFRIFASGEHI